MIVINCSLIPAGQLEVSGVIQWPSSLPGSREQWFETQWELSCALNPDER